MENLSVDDVPIAGGKNASLGEMIRSFKDKGIRVPDGFATTAEAYWDFLGENNLKDHIRFSLKEMIPIIEKNLGQKARKMITAQSGSKTTKTVATLKKEQSQFVLSDDEILMLARWATLIEKHYGKPMDMEWAKDGKSKELFIVQARPETVQSQRKKGAFKTYVLKEKGKKILQGLAIGDMISIGKVQVIKQAKDLDRFEKGSILVTGTTDPDWVPVMKKAAGIITDHGGRTSHAAIVSRELGVPAIVGTGRATETLANGELITLSCAEGENRFYLQRETGVRRNRR